MLKGVKKGQVSIFIIVALIIVLGVGVYFVVKGESNSYTNEKEFSGVFSYYESCISQYTETGLSVAASQGGKIEQEPYLPGSNYAPFGNALVVSGVSASYWLSVSGSGVIEENVPTEQGIENELNSYVSSRLSDCNFDRFRSQGLEIVIEGNDVKSTIAPDGILVKVSSILSVSNENSSASRDEFQVSVESSFGSLFEDAQEIYQKEQKDLFLENYSYDVLRLYAPVDGVEVQCAPKTWVARDVITDLQTGLKENLATLSFGKTSEPDYFHTGLSVESDVQVIYDPAWPSRFEIYGNKGELLVGEPVGNQFGLQALGFCYVPYHFVYDLMFPVLVRLHSGEDFFQFPVVVVIDKNLPRSQIASNIIGGSDQTSLCDFATQDIKIDVRSNSEAIKNASIFYNCFDQSCFVGETSTQGRVVAKVPACLNGILEAKADGYSTEAKTFSSSNESEAEIFLEKLHSVQLSLLVDGKKNNGQAFISFDGENGIVQGVIPEVADIEISPGFYNVSVYQYGNSSIRIPATKTTQCQEVSAGGLAGIFGQTKEQCYEINIPETIIDRALTAGGQGELYLSEELLEKGELVLTVNSLPKPTGIDSLEANYALFETQGVDVLYE